MTFRQFLCNKVLLSGSCASLVALSLVAAQANESPANASTNPVTVTLWSWTPLAVTMAKMVSTFEATHPGIKINTTIETEDDYQTALKAAAASGTLPDLMALQPGAFTQEYRPYLQPLQEIASTLWGPDWTTKFVPALSQVLLGNPARDTSYYMIPEETEAVDIVYDRTIFEKLHLTAPPDDLAQMMSDAQKMTNAGYIGFFQGGATGLFDNWLFAQIASQTDLSGILQGELGKPTWTQPGILKAATIWKSIQPMFQTGAMGTPVAPIGNSLLAAGRVGMILFGSWWMQQSELADQPPGVPGLTAFGHFPFPPIQAGGKPSPALGGVDFGWGITKNADRSPALEAATTAVFDSIISGPMEGIALNALNDLPAFKGLQPHISLSPQQRQWLSSYETEEAKAVNDYISNPTVNEVLSTSLQAIAVGTQSPRAAMEAVNRAAS